MLKCVLAIGAVALVLGSCHRRSAETAPAPAEGWTLTIVNHHWLDVSVYVTSDGQRSHVGLVAATRTLSFDMPARLISIGRQITLEADPVGSPRSVRTEMLSIQGGQTVQWTLESGLERSSVAVW